MAGAYVVQPLNEWNLVEFSSKRNIVYLHARKGRLKNLLAKYME